jgi:hypothetical protein
MIELLTMYDIADRAVHEGLLDRTVIIATRGVALIWLRVSHRRTATQSHAPTEAEGHPPTESGTPSVRLPTESVGKRAELRVTRP